MMGAGVWPSSLPAVLLLDPASSSGVLEQQKGSSRYVPAAEQELVLNFSTLAHACRCSAQAVHHALGALEKRRLQGGSLASLVVCLHTACLKGAGVVRRGVEKG